MEHAVTPARPRFTVIEAPSVLGLFPKGVEKLSDVLLTKGLGERLEARLAGRVEPPPYDHRRDPETMLLNPKGIADYSRVLADAVERAIDGGSSPSFSAATARLCSVACSL